MGKTCEVNHVSGVINGRLERLIKEEFGKEDRFLKTVAALCQQQERRRGG